MTWTQNYDPFSSGVLSPLIAALPIVLLLGMLASGRVPAPLAALAGLLAAYLTAVFAFVPPESGTPILTLAKVTGLSERTLSAMAGRQLPFFSLLIPAWLVWVMAGWQGVLGVWPALVVCGGSFALVQFLTANFHGPWLVDVIGGL